MNNEKIEKLFEEWLNKMQSSNASDNTIDAFKKCWFEAYKQGYNQGKVDWCD